MFYCCFNSSLFILCLILICLLLDLNLDGLFVDLWFCGFVGDWWWFVYLFVFVLMQVGLFCVLCCFYLILLCCVIADGWFYVFGFVLCWFYRE